MPPSRRHTSLILSAALALILGSCGRNDPAPTTPPPATANEAPAASLSTHSPATTPLPDTPAQEIAATPPPPSAHELLARLNPDNALETRAALRALPSDWKNHLGPFYRAWGTLDPQAALDAALADEDVNRHAGAAMAVEGWASTNPAAAKSWVDHQPDANHRLHYMRSLVKGWPPARLSELSDGVAANASDASASPLITQLASTWAAANPSDTARWLDSLPEGEARAQATQALFLQWGTDDPTAASEYLASIENTQTRDRAISAFARAIAAEDIEAAAIWAREITDPTLRAQILAALPKIRDYHATGLK